MILFSALLFFSLNTHDNPLPADTSLTVVMPCAIQSLYTYSAGVPCSTPPICVCISMNPGRAYMPSAFNSFPFAANFGLLAGLILLPSEPTVTIFTILLFSITISTGPSAGAPVPLMMVTPLMINWV